MIVFRFLSDPSFIGLPVPDFWDRLKEYKKGNEVCDVFATPDIPSVVNMANHADEIVLYSGGGHEARKYVAVIEAQEWTTDVTDHPSKLGHRSEFDEHELIVIRGTVRELLPYSADRWTPHNLSFIEKYGMGVQELLEKNPRYEEALRSGVVKNLVSWG